MKQNKNTTSHKQQNETTVTRENSSKHPKKKSNPSSLMNFMRNQEHDKNKK